MAGLELQGVASTIKQLEQIERNVRDAARESLTAFMEDVLVEARNRAPERTTKLVKRSRVIRQFRRRKRPIVIAIEFRQPYAIAQHEGFYFPGPVTQAKLGSSKRGAGRKYLERPFEEKLPQGLRDLGIAVERALRLTIPFTRTF